MYGLVIQVTNTGNSVKKKVIGAEHVTSAQQQFHKMAFVELEKKKKKKWSNLLIKILCSAFKIGHISTGATDLLASGCITLKLS